MAIVKELLYCCFVVAFCLCFLGVTESASAGNEESLRFRLALRNDSTPKFEGFSEFVGGEDMQYISHLSPNSTAHIARASEILNNTIEWKTALIPGDWQGEKATFLWVAGIGANFGAREFHLYVDGKDRFIFSTCSAPAWTVKGIDGGELSFVSVTTDKFGDQFGYMKMTVPSSWLTPGRSLNLKIVGETVKSNALVMVFKVPNAVSGLAPIDKDLFYTVHMRYYLISSIDIISLRQDWAGKAVSLVCGKNVAGEARLVKDGDLVKAVLQLSPHLRVNADQALFLAVDGKEIAKLDSREYARERLLAFLEEEVTFDHKIFPPGDFPKPMWKRPGMVDNEAGEFDLTATFYDANYNRVNKAEKPGRYGAVVEAVLPDGYHFQRYITLFCYQDQIGMQPGGFNIHMDQVAPFGIPESVWNARHKTIDRCMGETFSRCYFGDIPVILRVNTLRWRMLSGKIEDTGDIATILAGITDLGDKPVKDNYATDPFNLDRQWWVKFKRHQFGIENKYPPLKLPAKTDTVSTTVLHEGDPASVGYSKERIEAIRQVCREWVQEGKEPFAVLVACKGVIVLQEPFGEYPDGKKMTMDTQTWMASITKLMIGCLMMQFVDQGLINLDDPVAKYLPELTCNVGTPLTIRHLCTHTSGLWGNLIWGADWNSSFENVAGEYMPYLEVGKKHEYNDINYTVVAKIMERVSGKALPFLFQESLLEPLNIEHTCVQGASGDARSICMDMAKIGQMLSNHGSYGNVRFFSDVAFQKMMPLKIDKLVPGSNIEWGIGVTVESIGTNRGFGHGACSGAITVIDPQNDIIVICCRNQFGLRYREYAGKFMRACAAPFDTTAIVPAK